MSRFHITGPMGQNKARHYVLRLPGGGTTGQVWWLQFLTYRSDGLPLTYATESMHYR